jgi:hypothetical protein
MRDILRELIRLWETSTIVSGLLALALMGTVIYLACTERAIPEALGYAFTAVIAYFFTDKARKDQVRESDRLRAFAREERDQNGNV